MKKIELKALFPYSLFTCQRTGAAWKLVHGACRLFVTPPSHAVKVVMPKREGLVNNVFSKKRRMYVFMIII